MARICVDMDEVMADTLAEHLRRYNQEFDEEVKVDDLVGKGLWEITPLDRQQQLRAFLDAEDFFEDLPLMPDSQRGAQRPLCAIRNLHCHPGDGRSQLTRPKIPLAAAALLFHSAHSLRFLRKQKHSARRLPDRRPAQEPAAF